MQGENNSIKITKKPSNSYFASSNSGCGFVSYFDKIFDRSSYNKIFILKGGPGTGKSSLMKKATIIAEELDLPYEHIVCSPDPESLDEVIIKKENRRTAILDGTAPHVQDTVIPGAVDEIVNLGSAWNESILQDQRERISELTRIKKNAYISAYSQLRCAYILTKRKHTLIDECIEREKMIKAVARMVASKRHSISPTKYSYKLKRAISSDGPIETSIYEQEYADRVAVYGAHGASYAVIQEIYDQLKDKVSSITISPAPLIPDCLDALSIDEMSMSFYDCGRTCDNSNTKAINSERFLKYDMLKSIKPELRMLTRLADDAMNCAYKMLLKAKQAHFSIEDIYINAMDFSNKEKIENELFDRIFN